MRTRRKVWTKAEIGYVRRWYRRVQPAILAERLDVPVRKVYDLAKRLGLSEKRTNRKVWTKAEIGYVRRWYGRRQATTIAEHLRVPLDKVYRLANRLGLAEKRKSRRPKIERVIRRLHPKGWSDSEIAAKAVCSREWISELRRELGLPSNANNARHRERVRRKTLEQCRKAGVRNLGMLRAKIHRDRAEAAGWPRDLRPRHVEILDLLYDEGPKTRREIADAIGMPWHGSRKSLVSNDPEGSYLAHLMARNLVVCLPRVVQTGGQGQNVSLYMVPANVHRDEEARKENRCTSQESTIGHRRRPQARASRTSCGRPSRKK